MAVSLAVNVLFRVAFVVRTQPTPTWERVYQLIAIIVIAAPVPLIYRKMRWGGLVIFCVVHPLCTAVVHYVLSSLATDYWEYFGSPMVFIPVKGLLPFFLNELDLGIYGLLACFSALGLCRLFFGRLSTPDLYHCRQCGYDLTGCVGPKCSECGHEFDFEILGVTEEELADRRRKCGRVTRPVSRTKKRGHY